MENSFQKDVHSGLSAKEKHLSSKYFYDDKGSQIFQEIMAMPEYYLTNCEFDIFQNVANSIFKSANFQSHFNLIELGAGDGVKTAELIDYLVKNNIDFTYKPVDISQKANDILAEKLLIRFPNLKIEPQTGDYFDVLRNLQKSNSPSLLLFIGSNIGNYTNQAAKELFRLFNACMNKGDKLLVGVDLKKDSAIIIKAYSDPHGITKRFNLNLLTRINRELEADFDLNQFDFRAIYDRETGELKSYLISLIDQKVIVKKINLTVNFKKNESIWTELSKKYDLVELEDLINTEGFRIIAHFLDKRQYFTDSLFEKV